MAEEKKEKKSEEDLVKKGEENKLSPSSVDKSKTLEECEKLKEEYLAGWQRARADLLNHKKEEMERVGELLEYARIEFVLKFLPILDNLEIAEGNLTDNLKEDDSVKGLLLIKKQIQDFLKNQGLEEIESVGQKLDLNLHEVVAEAEAEGESGVILEEMQKGYKINGRLLRPAKVKVAK